MTESASPRATSAAVSISRSEARKAKTRAALVSAARRLLAAGTTTASIQDITELADVGFGTFYNHFETKEALFAAAVDSALEDWTALRDQAVAGLVDPAEIFATSFRMTGRLQRSAPEIVRIVLTSGLAVLVPERALRVRAVSDIAAGIASGRFRFDDVAVATMASGGALLGLLQLLDADPSLDDGVVTDRFTERVLVMLGIDEAEAGELVARPMPPPPRLV